MCSAQTVGADVDHRFLSNLCHLLRSQHLTVRNMQLTLSCTRPSDPVPGPSGSSNSFHLPTTFCYPSCWDRERDRERREREREREREKRGERERRERFFRDSPADGTCQRLLPGQADANASKVCPVLECTRTLPPARRGGTAFLTAV